MRPISLRHLCFSPLLIAAALACSSDTTLAPAIFENAVDTTVLYALTGTAIGTPSAFDVVLAEPVRTDQILAFDFAVDLADDGSLRLLPIGVLGFVPEAGILLSSQTFDGIRSAPLDGYVTDSTLTATTGTVFVLRSRASALLCTYGGSLPRYGKFRVLEIDPSARAVTLEFLVNRNCGYRSLDPGLPTQ